VRSSRTRPADRVHERDAVRAGTRCGGRSRADIVTSGRELRVERLRRSQPARGPATISSTSSSGEETFGHDTFSFESRRPAGRRVARKARVFLRGEPVRRIPTRIPRWVEEARRVVAEKALDPRSWASPD
jgi:hypothetical protein